MMSERIQKTLDTNIAELNDRLTKGWEYCNANSGDRDAQDLWLSLLEQYERAHDARHGTVRKEF